MLKTAIVGATGYTGGELLRLLAQHPKTELVAATSEQHHGKSIESVFPNLIGQFAFKLESLNLDRLIGRADHFFLALPHTKSMSIVDRLIKENLTVIDLSADFRIKNPKSFEKWYGTPHTHPELLSLACYGLPELHRKAIRKARFVANPGCYPTGAVLGLIPFLAQSKIETDGIIIDAKSGVSGVGRAPSPTTHFPEVNEALSAYHIGRHRHIPEIEQELSSLAKKDIMVTFSPHLVPINRGILTTIYVRLTKPLSVESALELFHRQYESEPFVHLLPAGELPNTRNVEGSNHCHIGLAADPRNNRTMVVVTAIDNLVKGAAGQAVQNMNLMMGFEESLGLTAPGLFP